MPMEVIQVNAVGLPARFPAAAIRDHVPSNLPVEMTTFIGRDDDLARLSDLISEHRLVTLLGPGGTGKTRLAIEAGTRQLDRFPDGVWLVELAPVKQPDLVIAHAADVWGLGGGQQPR